MGTCDQLGWLGPTCFNTRNRIMTFTRHWKKVQYSSIQQQIIAMFGTMYKQDGREQQKLITSTIFYVGVKKDMFLLLSEKCHKQIECLQ